MTEDDDDMPTERDLRYPRRVSSERKGGNVGVFTSDTVIDEAVLRVVARMTAGEKLALFEKRRTVGVNAAEYKLLKAIWAVEVGASVKRHEAQQGRYAGKKRK